MADLPRIGAAQVATAQTITTTTELAVATTSPASCPSSGGGVLVQGHVELTTGTGTTGMTVRIRRGTGITGTVVGSPQNVAIGAAVVAHFDTLVLDTLIGADQAVYTLTVQAAGASANGTVNQATVAAFVLA